MNPSDNIQKAIWYMLAASFAFALMGAAAKVISDSINSVEIVFFRNAFGTILIFSSFLKSPLKQGGGKPLLLIFRGLAGTIALFAVFYNVAHMPLGKVVTYVQTAPIFIAAFAAFFLKEHLSTNGWIGVLIGFAGIVLIAQPHGEGFSKLDILGILSGVGAAAAYTSIRELQRHYDHRVIVLSFMFSGTLLPLLGMIAAEWVQWPGWDFLIAPFVMPQGIEWLWIIIVGLTAAAGQILITRAYSYSKAGIVATVGYSNIVFATGIGLLMGDAMLGIWTLIGIALVVLSGSLAAKEKH